MYGCADKAQGYSDTCRLLQEPSPRRTTSWEKYIYIYLQGYDNLEDEELEVSALRVYFHLPAFVFTYR